MGEGIAVATSSVEFAGELFELRHLECEGIIVDEKAWLWRRSVDESGVFQYPAYRGL